MGDGRNASCGPRARKTGKAGVPEVTVSSSKILGVLGVLGGKNCCTWNQDYLLTPLRRQERVGGGAQVPAELAAHRLDLAMKRIDGGELFLELVPGLLELGLLLVDPVRERHQLLVMRAQRELFPLIAGLETRSQRFFTLAQCQCGVLSHLLQALLITPFAVHAAFEYGVIEVRPHVLFEISEDFAESIRRLVRHARRVCDEPRSRQRLAGIDRHHRRLRDALPHRVGGGRLELREIDEHRCAAVDVVDVLATDGSVEFLLRVEPVDTPGRRFGRRLSAGIWSGKGFHRGDLERHRGRIA